MDMSPWHHAHTATARSLYAANGQRKYLTLDERRRFLEAAHHADQDTERLCLTLAYTGCRISEALALTRSSILVEEGVVAIRSLKKRGQLVVREVPVPQSVLTTIVQDRQTQEPDTPLCTFGRTEAWKRVAAVMHEAHVTGIRASSRGLRHGFAVSAVLSGVPLNIVQKWLGHASIATTAIYTNVVGAEERDLAQKVWQTWSQVGLKHQHRHVGGLDTSNCDHLK